MIRQSLRSIFFSTSRSRRAFVVALGVFVCVMLAWSVATFARYIPTRVYSIPSNSMAPTIGPGDRVGVRVSSYPRPKRAEIWVFKMPAASGNAPNHAVKRVIGLPGESVEVTEGHVLIDGQPIEEPYLSTPVTYTLPALKLGTDEYFMLGDSRNSSHDSHVWGPLPADHLIGPVTVRFWPVRKIGGF